MHAAEKSDVTPALWKKSSLMARGLRLAAAIVAVAGAEGFVSIAHPVVAQTPAAPAVRVQRDDQLGGRVWPVDLDRDGITDLVSTGAGGLVQVSIGKGDGTFKPPVLSAFQGEVIAVGDFNGDSRPDVVASRGTVQTTYVILPGKGTATLGAPVTVASVNTDFTWTGEAVFALSADFDGDTKRDLVLATSVGVNVYPGHGDFTFGTPTQLVTFAPPGDGIVADLNHDGRPDLVTADGENLTVFLNGGAMTFAAADVPATRPPNDVTVADVDRDGRLDLLAAAGHPDSDSMFGEGWVLVYHGNGDGTFAPAVEYPVLNGPTQVVVGDFNRDGLIDVATGNQSTIVRDDCASTFKTWDSVSVLTGRGNGTFTAARNFSVGDQSLMDPSAPGVDRYRQSLVSLNTSDLNGDHATDLIASHGAILFNIPAVANRPPTVNAGPDQVLLGENDIIFRPAASDPDEDVLTYDIRDAAGNFHATYPNACFVSPFTVGDNLVTVTVSDGHGHSATDKVVYTVVEPDGESGQFAAGNDIGRVASAGGDAYDSATDTYTVRGSGADIWGTADEFHYVWTTFTGDFEITARVDSVQNVNAWTKAGVMIRENLNAGAVHAGLFASPGKGVAFQRRTVENGISVHTAGPATTAPVWLKLRRTDAVITAYYRKETTDEWTRIGDQTYAALPGELLVGLAVTSHADGKVAAATFSNVTVQNPLPLVGHAIGTGSGFGPLRDGVTLRIDGQGADIWGSADAFFYAAMPYSNDLTITAQVESIAGFEPWTKAGVMIREDLTAGSRHVMAVVTPGKGVAMQYRGSPRAASVQVADVPGAAPAWVRLVRSHDTFTASWSSDGEDWKVLGSVHVPFAAAQFYVGLPVTSHNAGPGDASAIFRGVSIDPPF
jgi:hypothetical protein